jgi:hypothetical protein
MDMLLPRRILVVVLGAALALAVVVVLPKVSSAQPPVPVDDDFVATGYCDFPVHYEATGHVKFRPLPGGDFLVSGAAVSTLTNVDNPENQLVDRGGGFSGRITPLTDEGLGGDVLVVARGHNLLFDPGEGIFLTIGKVKFTVAGGPGVGGDITILKSRGKVIDVCARLA